MFEQTFKNIDDILHKDAGCTSELDYTEQSSWLLFLKYLDALEADKATEAELEGKAYSFILDKAYRWESWAAPKNADGKFDHNSALTGDDLLDFVNRKLFPYLGGFKQRASGPNTITRCPTHEQRMPSVWSSRLTPWFKPTCPARPSPAIGSGWRATKPAAWTA